MPSTAAFPLYLTSASLWVAAMSLQGFLITWMLVGILEQPADHVGFARAMIEVPALAVLLVGGVLADRVDGRALLLRLHLIIALPCAALAVAAATDALGYWIVVAGAMAVAALQSTADPARQSMLSRVARTDIQRTVTLMTIVTSLVGLVGVWIGGQLERIGLTEVLVLQALLFASGALAIRRLPAMPVAAGRARPHVLAGIRASWRMPLIRNVIALNFLSSLFNAGAYVIAVPFIVRDIYHGDADFFATVMIVFTVGSIGSNVVMLRYMPLHRPGRLFIWMQISRVVILGLLYLKPGLVIFHLCILAWGLNMGVTTTLVRTTVQELAPDEHRAQVLSVLLVSFMVSAPVSAMLLGTLIAGYDPLIALVPGIVISLVIFAAGILWSGLWTYESADGLRRRAATAVT